MTTDAATGSVRRRAPFSANPAVGRRGRQTQQRILDAAIHVLSDEGYQRCSIDRITHRAGCSRVAFYQYFASREDVFEHLAAEVAREVAESIDAIPSLTANTGGRDAVGTWVHRYADIFARYGPIFRAFEVAAESAETVADLRVRAARRNIACIRSRLPREASAGHDVDGVIGLLLDATARVYYMGELLHVAAPDGFTRDRLEESTADVFHRALFGVDPDVNLRSVPRRPAAPIPFAGLTTDAAGQPATAGAAGSTASTVQALLAAGREAFLARGYHGTRVDDIVLRAGLSHGAFYRYFRNKTQFAHVLVLQAMQPLSVIVGDLVAAADADALSPTALRRWLAAYNDIQVDQAGAIRIWVDASSHDTAFGVDAAAALDWGRRRLARVLRPRGFGDVDADAVVMMALLDAFGARRSTIASLEAVAAVIERGLLAR